jgi:hypothetical protein
MFGCFVNLWEVEGLFCKSLGSTVYGWVVSKFEVFFWKIMSRNFSLKI